MTQVSSRPFCRYSRRFGRGLVSLHFWLANVVTFKLHSIFAATIWHVATPLMCRLHFSWRSASRQKITADHGDAQVQPGLT